MTDPSSTGEGGVISALYSDAGLEADGPAKRTNKRGQQTRERLIQAAAECFTEYGYTRTRVSDVVRRAGNSQGNFYRHFNSLDDIFLAVLRPGLEGLSAVSPKRSGDSAELSSLIETNTAYLHTYARHRHILRLLREAAASSPNDGFQALWLRVRGDFVARTHRWLVRLHEAGKIEGDGLGLLAESLGCLTEQLAYVNVGLPAVTPRLERIDELGESLGRSWYRLVSPAE